MRGAFICLLIAAILCGLGISASADDLDLTHLGAISVTPYDEEGEPVAVEDGSMTLYHVADIIEENNGTYGYKYTEDFQDCGIDLDVTDPDMAQAAASYAAENDLTGWEKHFAGSDTVTFNGISVGLYLIVQTGTSTGMEPIKPFLVSVPLYEDGVWQYDVDATPKVILIPSTSVEVTPTPAAPTNTPAETPAEGEAVTPTPEVTTSPDETETPAIEVTPTPESSSSPVPVPGTEETPGPEDETDETPTPSPEEDETESTPSPETPVTDTTATGGTGTTSGGGGTTSTTETLPQTGQLYWPVFLFGGLGTILVALGLIIRFTGRRGRKEFEA